MRKANLSFSLYLGTRADENQRSPVEDERAGLWAMREGSIRRHPKSRVTFELGLERGAARMRTASRK